MQDAAEYEQQDAHLAKGLAGHLCIGFARVTHPYLWIAGARSSTSIDSKEKPRTAVLKGMSRSALALLLSLTCSCAASGVGGELSPAPSSSAEDTAPAVAQDGGVPDTAPEATVDAGAPAVAEDAGKADTAPVAPAPKLDAGAPTTAEDAAPTVDAGSPTPDAAPTVNPACVPGVYAVCLGADGQNGDGHLYACHDMDGGCTTTCDPKNPDSCASSCTFVGATPYAGCFGVSFPSLPLPYGQQYWACCP